MSRSGYSYDDDDDNWSLIKYRGAVASAIRGKRGQALLRAVLAALDAMPEKRLIADDLVFQGDPEFPYPRPEEDIIVGGDRLVNGNGHVVNIGDCCALGALARHRGMDVSNLDPHDPEYVADAFGVNDKLIREITWANDEDGPYGKPETPEERFIRVRKWVAAQIRDKKPA
jgi:hypothetical protein